MEGFLLLLACHFVGDFALQDEWQTKGKAKSWEINFYHVAIYTAVFILFGAGLSALSLGIIFMTHFAIDTLSSRWKNIKHIWQDQILHILVLLFIFFVTK
jgi:hypothetical protein